MKSRAVIKVLVMAMISSVMKVCDQYEFGAKKFTSRYQLVTDCTLEIPNIEPFSGGFGQIR